MSPELLHSNEHIECVGQPNSQVFMRVLSMRCHMLMCNFFIFVFVVSVHFVLMWLPEELKDWLEPTCLKHTSKIGVFHVCMVLLNVCHFQQIRCQRILGFSWKLLCIICLLWHSGVCLLHLNQGDFSSMLRDTDIHDLDISHLE